MIAEGCGVGLVELGERAHVGEEAQRLDDVGQLRAGVGEAIGEVAHRLFGLGGHATFDDDAVEHPTLARHDDEVPGANERRVRTERLVHAADTRRRALFGRCDDVSDGKSTKDSEVPQIEGTGR